MPEMDPIICIDFGNSYTKVAVRKQPETKGRPSQFGLETVRVSAHSEAIQDDSLLYDPLSKATIPTAVGYTEYGQNPDFFAVQKLRQWVPMNCLILRPKFTETGSPDFLMQHQQVIARQTYSL